jgi:hypothetical protein
LTKIMVIDGRHVSTYDSFQHAARMTGFTEEAIAKLINNGKMRDGLCFDIALDSDDKE